MGEGFHGARCDRSFCPTSVMKKIPRFKLVPEALDDAAKKLSKFKWAPTEIGTRRRAAIHPGSALAGLSTLSREDDLLRPTRLHQRPVLHRRSRNDLRVPLLRLL